MTLNDPELSKMCSQCWTEEMLKFTWLLIYCLKKWCHARPPVSSCFDAI